MLILFEISRASVWIMFCWWVLSFLHWMITVTDINGSLVATRETQGFDEKDDTFTRFFLIWSSMGLPNVPKLRLVFFQMSARRYHMLSPRAGKGIEEERFGIHSTSWLIQCHQRAPHAIHQSWRGQARPDLFGQGTSENVHNNSQFEQWLALYLGALTIYCGVKCEIVQQCQIDRKHIPSHSYKTWWRSSLFITFVSISFLVKATIDTRAEWCNTQPVRNAPGWALAVRALTRGLPKDLAEFGSLGWKRCVGGILDGRTFLHIFGWQFRNHNFELMAETVSSRFPLFWRGQ